MRKSSVSTLNSLSGRWMSNSHLFSATISQFAPSSLPSISTRRRKFVSIHGLNDDKPVLSNVLPPDRAPAPDQQAERREILEAMTRAVMDLPRRDKRILLLYYGRELTMKETAAMLGVTESRISQLHASALFKLSVKLDASP